MNRNTFLLLLAMRRIEMPFPNGSAGAPSITFTDDPDTGFWSVAANNIGVSVGGNERFRFGSGGLFTAIGGISFGNITSTPHANIQSGAAAVASLYASVGTSAGAAFEFLEMTPPAAPGANKVRLYAEDDGAGKTRIVALFPTGAAQVIATEP